MLLATSALDLAVAEFDASDCLSTNWLLQQALQYNGPGSVLLLLSCCHAAAIGEEQLRPELQQLRERLDVLGHRLVQPVPGSATMRLAISAVGSREQAREIDGLTDFVRLLVEGLEGAAGDPHDGCVTPGLLANHVAKNTAEKPVRSGTETGRLSLAYDPRWRGRAASRPQPWVNVPASNPQFRGRVEELAQLGAWLADDGVTTAALMPAISGIGGIGKSQLAIQFAHQYRERFPSGVFWISAEQVDTIELQIAACGGQAGLRLSDDEPQLGEHLRIGRSKSNRPLKLEPLDIESGLRLLAEPRAASRGEDVIDVLADAKQRAALAALGDELGWLPLALSLAGKHLGGRVLGFSA